MLSLAELRRAAAVIDRDLAGCLVQAAIQPDAWTVVLGCYGALRGAAPARHPLVLSAHPDAGRVSLAGAMPRAGGPPPAFAQYLRAHLVGGRLVSARLLGDDRQLALRVRHGDHELDLLLALFGRRSNLLVLDAEGRILLALRPLAETRPELSPGDVWQSPASRPRSADRDRFAEVGDDALLAEIDAAYAIRTQQSEREAWVQRIAQALRRERKALERKREKLEAEMAAAEASVGLERTGELLKTALSRITRGDRAVVVRDWDTGEDVTIPLDPLLEPAENLERVFARYRKALRTLTKGGPQLDAVTASAGTLAALERALEAAVAADDPDAIASLADHPALARLLERGAPSVPAGAAPTKPQPFKVGGRVVPAKLVPRRYRTESGLEVWVGRSDAANDYLTTRLARGKDLFFHLDGAPGSHVILRTEGRDDPPAEAVLDACELAVHYSKAKKASRADVHVVPIRNVRKPKGAKPGLVMVHGGKTVHLRRVPARLERILAARIED